MKTKSKVIRDLVFQRELSESNEESAEERPQSLKNEKWDTFAYTGIICVIQMAFGTSIATIGPALVDFKHIFKISLQEIALIPLFLTIGYFLGLLFGFLNKYINRQMTLIALIILSAISSALIPYSKHIWQLYVSVFVNGLGLGVWNNGHTVWIIEMWRQRSTPALQLSCFMYGIGRIIGPLVVKPYLTGESINYASALTSNETTEFNTNYMLPKLVHWFNSPDTYLISTFIDQTPDEIDRRSKLKTPFLITASLHIIGIVSLTIMLFIKKYKIRKEETNELNEEKMLDNGKTKTNKTLILCLIALFGAFICVSEEIYLQFSATYYQYIPLRLTASDAAEIVSVMALTNTIGRGFNFFVAIKFKPQLMIAIHTIIIYISMVTLFFAQKSINTLWTGSLLMSFGFAPVYPLVFGLAGRYLEVTSIVSTIIMLSTDSLNVFLPFIFGRFIEKSPRVFIWSTVTCISISTLLFICIVYIVFRIKKLNSQRCKSIKLTNTFTVDSNYHDE